MQHKAPEIQCQWCKQMISSYNLSNHIKFSHKNIGSVEEYVLEFGEFRKNKEPKKGTRNIAKIKCGICNKECSIVGMHNHLRDAHEHTPDSYISAGYLEYRPKQIDYSAPSRNRSWVNRWFETFVRLRYFYNVPPSTHTS